MATELIINASLPEIRIALLRDGEVEDLQIERPSGRSVVGNIYKGKVTRVLPGMQAAFVDIGLEKAAFLYVDDVYVHSRLLSGDASEEGADVPDVLEVASEDLAGESSEDFTEGLNEELSDELDDEEIQSGSESESVEGDWSEESTDESLEAASSSEDHESDVVDEDGEMDEDAEEDSDKPVDMGPPPSDDGEGEEKEPVAEAESSSESEGADAQEGVEASSEDQPGQDRYERGNRNPRRGRRFGQGRNPRRRNPRGRRPSGGRPPSDYMKHLVQDEVLEADRKVLSDSEELASPSQANGDVFLNNRTYGVNPDGSPRNRKMEFREKRRNDRRIRSRSHYRPQRNQAKIENLLKEGQEVIVQVAKEPIAAKGARLTCHISLAGRHLVCMPTIDHIGVSRRIESDAERRDLRRYVESHRRDRMGFIVRTASGGKTPEMWIQQDIDYLTQLWDEIQGKTKGASAPSLIYEDLNPVLRAARDWVSEDIDKVVIDSRFYFTEMKDFVKRFMSALSDRVELYHGDIPIFDAYGISTELHRALERKVWLKSGGYIVIDQAEALVAIDVNTGRFVGKKNLEDTIFKTNLEAVEEIAYQLRLRNCGGIIIIDLIDMEREDNKRRVVRQLENALKKDRARPTIVKISELGLIEMTRKRTRDTLVRALCQSCSHCEGKGFIKNRQTVAYEVLREIEREGLERDTARILVQAHPDVIDMLAIDHRETLDKLERRYRKQIYLQAVGDFHTEQFEVSTEKNKGRNLPPRRGRNHRPKNDYRGNPSDRDRSQGHRWRNENPSDSGEGQSEANYGSEDPSSGFSTGERTHPEESSIGSQGSTYPESVSPGVPSNDDEDYNEEDRLAFLRAQAAQDAALANLSPNQSTSQPSSYRAGKGAKKSRNDKNPRGSRHNHNQRGRKRYNRNYRPSGGGRSGGRGKAASSTDSDDSSRGGASDPSDGHSNPPA